MNLAGDGDGAARAEQGAAETYALELRKCREQLREAQTARGGRVSVEIAIWLATLVMAYIFGWFVGSQR